MKGVKILSGILWIPFLSLMFLSSGLSQSQPAGGIPQFIAGGHVLGFLPEGVYIAGGDHLLKVTFVDANRITPIADPPTSTDRQTPPLTHVIYPSLWNGISLTYEPAAGGIAKSSYQLKPGADVNQIRLRYNVPVQVNAQGALMFDFGTGQAMESPPIAWQDIGGQRSFISVFYCQLSDHEVGFNLGAYDAAHPLVIDPTLAWNTFLGSSGDDGCLGIAVDGNGNVYLTGHSKHSWGEPIRAFSGIEDAFVVKLNSSGALLWNTFLGSSVNDIGWGITVDGSGNLYIVGESNAAWGSPINSYAGGYDIFVAKVNTNGALQWHTFLGSTNNDYGRSIALDGSGKLYLTGYSFAKWGSPVNGYTGNCDVIVAQLNNSGALQWHTFQGSASSDYGYGIAVDGGGNAYLTGKSNATWGSPVKAYIGGTDAFVFKLNNSGKLQWNTFLGSPDDDCGNGIIVDGSGNVYLTGDSEETWGAPVSAFIGNNDAFVSKLNNNGVLQWNTFLGSELDDYGSGIAIHSSGNIYLTGTSYGSWGSPIDPYTQDSDAFVAKLNNSGTLKWNTFLGSSDDDEGVGIAATVSGNIYVGGFCESTWGAPINSYAGYLDGFVAMLNSDEVVPVELASFSATLNENAVTLEWSTATETDNYGFEVQRKNHAADHWKQIGMVRGNGTTTLPHAYSFVDADIMAGFYSYRLKQIDLDGGFEFSHEISIEVKLPSSISLAQNYPNPFNPETAINFSLKEAGRVILKIYNLQGQVIRTLVDEEKPSGSYSVIWNGTDDNGATIASGIYYCILKVNGFEEKKKLTFLK